MVWYLLKTWVGREEEMVKEVHKAVPEHMYEECFVIYKERIWRKQQRSMVHVELLFPGCVFLTCQTKKPILRSIEAIPAIARFIACGSLTILPIMARDAEFLSKISGEDHMVKLSYVQKDEQNNIYQLSEPLNVCQGKIIKYQFKKRYAMVRQRLWGEEQVIVFGILLREDASIPMKEIAIG